MNTIFSMLAHVCGLSHREAADHLDVRLDTIKSWSSGRNPTPPGALSQLAALADRIDSAADHIVETAMAQTEGMDRGDGLIQIGLATDDTEARDLGWPCVGAHRAALGLAAARLMATGYVVEVVPRGSTVATAAAADVHDRTRG